MQPSMSRTDLLLRCGWIFDNELVAPLPVAAVDDADESNDSDADASAFAHDPELPTRWGLAFHELMALAAPRFWDEEGALTITITDCERVAKKFGGLDALELLDSVAQAVHVLYTWLTANNPWSVNFIRGRRMLVEKAFALSPLTGEARECAPADPETHVYPDRRDFELPGTLDIAILPPRGSARFGRKQAVRTPRGKRFPVKLGTTLLLGDYKTGYPAAGKFEPMSMGQLWALALAACIVYGCDSVIVFVLHAPRGAPATVYASDVINREELQTNFAKRLRVAWRRKNDGSMRPGPHCDQLFCPARFPSVGDATGNSVCPTRRMALAEMGLVQLRTNGGPGALMLETPEQIGRVYELKNLAASTLKGVDAAIKAAVRRVGYGSLRDGKTLSYATSEPRMNLSKAAFERLHGKAAAAKKIEELDKDGWIEWKAREELRARNE